MKSEETRRYFEKYTRKERIKNWFYYYKWWLLAGVLALACAAGVIIQNVTRIKPDYYVAYVGEYSLSDETAAAAESALAALGVDLNGDGRVTVHLNQYPTAGENTGNAAMERAAWSTRLTSDLLIGESYFFLLTDPEGFEANYDVLGEERIDASALGPGLEGLTLARREFEPDREPENAAACAALWDHITEVFLPRK